ncbi:hypothetical protein LCGC14_1757890 [marine sediment metagenome]|uniref:Uncharacterized protein n=1 Tax=marine sediment metagenome TaxID=412755 RepID=A0A0F9H1Y3_9ZZZZ
MAHERVKFGDFTIFFEKILLKKIIPKPDVDVFIETINQLAKDIFKILPKVNEETLNLYQNFTLYLMIIDPYLRIVNF